MSWFPITSSDKQAPFSSAAAGSSGRSSSSSAVPASEESPSRATECASKSPRSWLARQRSDFGCVQTSRCLRHEKQLFIRKQQNDEGKTRSRRVVPRGSLEARSLFRDTQVPSPRFTHLTLGCSHSLCQYHQPGCQNLRAEVPLEFEHFSPPVERSTFRDIENLLGSCEAYFAAPLVGAHSETNNFDSSKKPTAERK